MYIESFLLNGGISETERHFHRWHSARYNSFVGVDAGLQDPECNAVKEETGDG